MLLIFLALSGKQAPVYTTQVGTGRHAARRQIRLQNHIKPFTRLVVKKSNFLGNLTKVIVYS
jgi:hypothetical protein